MEKIYRLQPFARSAPKKYVCVKNFRTESAHTGTGGDGGDGTWGRDMASEIFGGAAVLHFRLYVKQNKVHTRVRGGTGGGRDMHGT